MFDSDTKLRLYFRHVCYCQRSSMIEIFEFLNIMKGFSRESGMAGFVDSIPELLIVTYDLRYFLTPAEKYQGWFDSGLFAMSLVYALTDLGLGTCSLNWSLDPSRDKALRNVYAIPNEQNIAVLIAVGNVKKHYSVAKSPRVSVDEILC